MTNDLRVIDKVEKKKRRKGGKKVDTRKLNARFNASKCCKFNQPHHRVLEEGRERYNKELRGVSSMSITC